MGEPVGRDIVCSGGRAESAVAEDADEESRAFRAEARRWLRENAPRIWSSTSKTSVFGAKFDFGDEDPLEATRAWQRKKAENGWAALMAKRVRWTRCTPMQSIIWAQEEGIYSKLSKDSSLAWECAGRP